MALSSMTGFARTACEAAGGRFVWELKSVNGRGLELKFRLPAGFDHLEPALRSRTREAVARGICFFALQAERGADAARLTLNEAALTLVIAAARRLAAEEGIAMPSADGLLALPGVLEGADARSGAAADEERDAALLDSFASALQNLKAARAEEGRRLAAVLGGHLASIARLVESAAALAATAPEALSARIREQVALLTAESHSLDPERLHQEALLAATRADVREELDRLRSHVAAAGELLATGETVGRRLEFLAQEFNREANTLCSKAFDIKLTAIGMELKAVIDQFREQVQNLE